MTDQLFVRLDTAPASDSWGFVGRVLIGDHEAYRTIRAYPTPEEALATTQQLMGNVLGALLAGQEWREAHQEFGHAPRRAELDFGLLAKARRSDTDGTGSGRLG
jgi:hypothetical protein